MLCSRVVRRVALFRQSCHQIRALGEEAGGRDRLEEEKRKLRERLARERLLERDVVYRTQLGSVRVSAVRATRALVEAQRRWGFGPTAAALWGQEMAAAAMLASFLKGEERVISQVHFPAGPFEQLHVEAMRLGEVRGYVRRRHVPHASALRGNVESADVFSVAHLAKAQRSVSKILYNHARPYVTSVPAGDSIQRGWQAYYDMSEQVPTFLLLSAEVDPNSGAPGFCGGIAVQAMPPASATAGAGAVTAQSGAEQVARIRERMHTMSPANCPSMRHVMTTQGVLPYIAQVLGEGGERLTMEDVEVQPLDFHCRCSKESFMGHMLTLPTAQLDAMRAEGGTPLVCQFCNEEYFVTPAELRELSLHAAQQPQQPQQQQQQVPGEGGSAAAPSGAAPK